MAISPVAVSLLAQGGAKGAVGIFNFFESMRVAKDLEETSVSNAIDVAIDQSDFLSEQRNSAGGRGIRRTGSQAIAERVNVEQGKENLRRIVEQGFDAANTTRRQGFVNLVGTLVSAGGNVAQAGGRTVLEKRQNQLDFGSQERFKVPSANDNFGVRFDRGGRSLRG